MLRVDRWLGAVLIVLALVWLRLVQTQIPDAGGEWPGPRGFPLLLGMVLAILGGWMILFPESRTPDPGFRRHELGVATGTFGVLVLYAFLLERVGFLLATPVIVALAMAGLLRIRRWATVLSLAAGVTLGCWAIFEAMLGTPLPRGAWGLW